MTSLQLAWRKLSAAVHLQHLPRIEALRSGWMTNILQTTFFYCIFIKEIQIRELVVGCQLGVHAMRFGQKGYIAGETFKCNVLTFDWNIQSSLKSTTPSPYNSRESAQNITAKIYNKTYLLMTFPICQRGRQYYDFQFQAKDEQAPSNYPKFELERWRILTSPILNELPVLRWSNQTKIKVVSKWKGQRDNWLVDCDFLVRILLPTAWGNGEQSEPAGDE